MSVRAVEALLEFVLDTLVVMLLLKTGVFQRMRLFPPAKKEDISVKPMNLIAGLLVIGQIALLAVLDVSGKLPLTNSALALPARLGLSLMTLLPIILAAILAFLGAKQEKKD